jgi:hypothetical protein
VSPFHLRFTLSRRQRLALELPPWLPAAAATLGFWIGAAYAGLHASAWFLLLLVLPVVAYRGLFALAFDLLFRGGRAVELCADGAEVRVASAGEVKALPLDGLFQVFRDGDAWTVLHVDGTVLTIPADAISAEQVAYLRTFAHRNPATRAQMHGEPSA